MNSQSAAVKIATPKYVTPSAVLHYLRNGASILIIDVREGDRIGGHIKGSKHIPAPTFRSDPVRYLPLCEGKEKVIFHCMFSQVRGPGCANAFANALHRSSSQAGVRRPEVLIMSGGFHAFAQLALDGNLDAVENFDRDLYQ